VLSALGLQQPLAVAAAGGAAPASRDAQRALGLVSPPPKSTVLRHVRNLVVGDGASAPAASGAAAAWSYSGGATPQAVFTAVLAWLDGPGGWAALSPAEQAWLRGLPIIPVAGAELLPSSRVFLRLSEPLAPLMQASGGRQAHRHASAALLVAHSCVTHPHPPVAGGAARAGGL